jgi:hypothetical protein
MLQHKFLHGLLLAAHILCGLLPFDRSRRDLLALKQIALILLSTSFFLQIIAAVQRTSCLLLPRG